MTQIFSWTAKRAGGSITVQGLLVGTLEETKVTGVVEIICEEDRKPIAVNKSGEKFELL